MNGFSGGVWAVLGLIVAAGVVGVLHVLASAVRNHAHVAEVRHRVTHLRQEHARRQRGDSGPPTDAPVPASTSAPPVPAPAERRAA